MLIKDYVDNHKAFSSLTQEDKDSLSYSLSNFPRIDGMVVSLTTKEGVFEYRISNRPFIEFFNLEEESI